MIIQEEDIMSFKTFAGRLSTTLLLGSLLVACGGEKAAPAAVTETPSRCDGYEMIQGGGKGINPGPFENGTELEVTLGNESLSELKLYFYSKKPFSINGQKALETWGEGAGEHEGEFTLQFPLEKGKTVMLIFEAEGQVYLDMSRSEWTRDYTRLNLICYKFNDIFIPVPPAPNGKDVR
jgi:hypothetical protein